MHDIISRRAFPARARTGSLRVRPAGYNPVIGRTVPDDPGQSGKDFGAMAVVLNGRAGGMLPGTHLMQNPPVVKKPGCPNDSGSGPPSGRW